MKIEWKNSGEYFVVFPSYLSIFHFLNLSYAFFFAFPWGVKKMKICFSSSWQTSYTCAGRNSAL